MLCHYSQSNCFVLSALSVLFVVVHMNYNSKYCILCQK